MKKYFLLCSVVVSLFIAFDITNARVGPNFQQKQADFDKERELCPSCTKTEIMDKVNKNFPGDTYGGDGLYINDSKPIYSNDGNDASAGGSSINSSATTKAITPEPTESASQPESANTNQSPSDLSKTIDAQQKDAAIDNAAVDTRTNELVKEMESTSSATMSDEATLLRIEQKKIDPRTGVDVSSLSDDETTAQISQGNIDPRTGTWTDQALNGSTQKASGGSNDMTSSNFSFDVSSLSPSEKSYKDGTRINLKNILSNIGKYLLIATTTIAVLSLVIGGLMISTTGPSDRAAKGKTIIVLNITAIVIALLSYSIIRLVSWLIA